LIRDAAYEALPKSVRAELHTRFAEWLDARANLVELDEIVGHHLEQAARYQRELGLPADELAERAGERLAAAGRRAQWREDRHAASALFERALALTRPLLLDVLLEVDLAATLFTADAPRAVTIVDEAADRAAAAGDETGEAFARAIAAFHRFSIGIGSSAALEAASLKALPLLEQAGAHAALVHLWEAVGLDVANHRGRWADAAEAAQRALEHARLAGQQRTGLFFLELALILGPIPAQEALDRLDLLLPEAPSPFSLYNRAWLLAMLDRFDEAVPLARESNARQRELDGRLIGEWRLAEIAILAGDHEQAAAHLRELCAWLEQQALLAQLATYAPALGRELCALGRFDQAEPLAQRGRELGEPTDATCQALWRRSSTLRSVTRKPRWR
jgi:hypothetical protein